MEEPSLREFSVQLNELKDLVTHYKVVASPDSRLSSLLREKRIARSLLDNDRYWSAVARSIDGQIRWRAAHSYATYIHLDSDWLRSALENLQELGGVAGLPGDFAQDLIERCREAATWSGARKFDLADFNEELVHARNELTHAFNVLSDRGLDEQCEKAWDDVLDGVVFIGGGALLIQVGLGTVLLPAIGGVLIARGIEEFLEVGDRMSRVGELSERLKESRVEEVSPADADEREELPTPEERKEELSSQDISEESKDIEEFDAKEPSIDERSEEFEGPQDTEPDIDDDFGL